jgi:epoxide hydrolase-like predicted phosphatase
MITTIIFDIGGVLLRTEDSRHRRHWEQKMGLAPQQAEAMVFNSEMGQKAQQGEITERALWQWVGEQLDLSPLELQAFERDFWAGDVLDEQLVTFIRGLRPRYQTAVISNAMDGLRALLEDKYRIGDAFDLMVFSAEEQVMKPDRRIFDRTLSRLGRSASEAVFIDDFVHNIEGARAMGMQGIHFQVGMDLAAALVSLGVAV